ncbi:hypothetical protein BpHYR1_050479, partial [Brachionus plicatilis]
IVSRWNDLSQSVVNAETVKSFKSAIDKEVFGMVQRKRRKTATAQLELNAVWFKIKEFKKKTCLGVDLRLVAFKQSCFVTKKTARLTGQMTARQKVGLKNHLDALILQILDQLLIEKFLGSSFSLKLIEKILRLTPYFHADFINVNIKKIGVFLVSLVSEYKLHEELDLLSATSRRF